jgi:hypothetical protein
VRMCFQFSLRWICRPKTLMRYSVHLLASINQVLVGAAIFEQQLKSYYALHIIGAIKPNQIFLHFKINLGPFEKHVVSLFDG